MPFSIAGPAYSALPSLDGANRAAERISTGLQTSFANNAAEAAISGRLDTAIGESTISIRNATNQISALQKADQDLGQASELVSRIQAFSVQSGNPILSDTDQTAIQAEASAIAEQASDLIKNDTFNGQSLFGSVVNDIADSEGFAQLDSVALQEKLDGIRSGDSLLNAEALAELQDEISSARAGLGAEQNAISSRIDTATTSQLATEASQSRISDTDFATEFTNLIKEELLFQANVKVFDQQRLAEESLVNLLTQ